MLLIAFHCPRLRMVLVCAPIMDKAFSPQRHLWVEWYITPSVPGLRAKSTKPQQARNPNISATSSGFEAVDLNSETTSNQPTILAEERTAGIQTALTRSPDRSSVSLRLNPLYDYYLSIFFANKTKSRNLVSGYYWPSSLIFENWSSSVKNFFRISPGINDLAPDP